jgi:hypothetical protein
MLRTLLLLLPAVVPSWRFFDVIAPSPRIEFRLLQAPDDAAGDWREFRPRPAHVSLRQMLGRLFWNPRWNESLFLVSCAERLLDEPTDHSSDEISRRIAFDFPGATGFLQFRLIVLSRREGAIVRDVAYVSESRRLVDAAAT